MGLHKQLFVATYAVDLIFKGYFKLRCVVEDFKSAGVEMRLSNLINALTIEYTDQCIPVSKTFSLYYQYTRFSRTGSSMLQGKHKFLALSKTRLR